MARSIHDTWGVMHRAEQADWSDDEVRRAIVAEARRNWFRQGILRESVRRRRRQGDLAPQPVHPDSVPIFVDDEAPYICHAAGEEDVRAMMHRLPPGSLDGLQAVRLCVDRSDARHEPRERDPFTHRLLHEIVPGVFASSIAGRYDRATATIELFAFLCEPAPIAPIGLHLKVVTLVTFLHEAAHHFDLTFRVRRSRWDLGDKAKKEAWARRVEREQAMEIVMPYVRERYARECDELSAWAEAHAGAAVPLEILLEEDAFRDLAHGALGGWSGDATRVAFARALHRAGANDHARAVVGAVLGDRPDHAGALAVSACIVQCADRDFEAGGVLCRRAIASDPGCVEAWEVLGRGYAIQGSWKQAALACEEALSRRYGDYAAATLAQAHLNLGEVGEVEADVARMRASGKANAALRADVYAVLARCWAEHWEDAHLVATRMLSTGKYDDWETWLAAVRFECAHRLQRPHLAGTFTDVSLAELEAWFPSWARRIRVLI